MTQELPSDGISTHGSNFLSYTCLSVWRSQGRSEEEENERPRVEQVWSPNVRPQLASHEGTSHRLTLDLWLAKDNRFLNPKSSYEPIDSRKRMIGQELPSDGISTHGSNFLDTPLTPT